MCGKSRQVVLGEKGQMCLRKDEKVYRLTLRQLLLPRSIVLTVVSLHLQESILYFFYSRTHSVSPKFKATTTTAPQKVLSVISREAVLCCSYGFGWLLLPLFLMERGGGRRRPFPSGFDGRKEPFLVTMAASLQFCLGNRKETTSSSSSL